MKMVMRPRYYCEHCKKASGSPSAMVRHERGCTNNPKRVCGMCAILSEAGGPTHGHSRDDLVKMMNEQGFSAMCKAAYDCPACILSALRKFNFSGDGESPPGVIGPADGRQEWSYTTAKKDWWDDFNSSQQE